MEPLWNIPLPIYIYGLWVRWVPPGHVHAGCLGLKAPVCNLALALAGAWPRGVACPPRPESLSLCVVSVCVKTSLFYILTS